MILQLLLRFELLGGGGREAGNVCGCESKWIHAERIILLNNFLFDFFFLHLSYWLAEKQERFVDVKVNGFTLGGIFCCIFFLDLLVFCCCFFKI